MRRRRIVTAAVACAVILGVALRSVQQQRALARRTGCVSALRSIGTALALYRQDQDGQLPPDLALLGEGNYLSDERMCVCPWGHKAPGAWKDVALWMDYYYVFWPSVTEGTARYPLMYDRRLSNHDGKGINILLVEQTMGPAAPGVPGSFHGQFFWDEGAEWLRKFAREHPSLPIPLPEDMRSAD
jgi:hypothetical protein